jgi:hypothetical protein
MNLYIQAKFKPSSSQVQAQFKPSSSQVQAPSMSNIIDNYYASAIKYKLINQVVKIILATSDKTIIFGGYPRDSIIHDYHSKQYYAKIDELGLSYIEARKNYNKETFLPEHKDRLLCANDIDCYMPTETIELFDTILKKNLLEIKKKKLIDFSRYTNTKDIPSDLILYRYTIGFVMSGILTNIFNLAPTIQLDIVHTDNTKFKLFKPPFAKLDFECNGLIMTNSDHQVILSDQLKAHNMLDNFEKLQKIITKLCKYETDMVDFPYKTHRLLKMMTKGITIHNDHDLLISTSVDEDDVCVICLEKVKSKSNIRRTCCRSLYHIHCYSKMYSHKDFNHTCPTCRIDI